MENPGKNFKFCKENRHKLKNMCLKSVITDETHPLNVFFILIKKFGEIFEIYYTLKQK